METHILCSVCFSRPAVAGWLWVFSLMAAVVRAEPLPPSITHDRLRAETQPYYFTENDTVEAAQFRWLRESARRLMTVSAQPGPMHPDLARMPENQRSIAAIRGGARNYLQRWWQRHWESRRAAAAAGDSLHAKWTFYAHDESELFRVTQELGFDILEVRPKPLVDETILQQLNGAVPASSSDADTILLRGLLSGPCDRQLADAIVSFVARMQQHGGASRPAGLGSGEWMRVFLSADPLLIGSAVDWLCSNQAPSGSQDALEALLIAARKQRRTVLTEEMALRLVRECPQEALIRVLERAGDYLADRIPGLDKAFLAPDTPRAIRIALVRTLLRNDPVMRRIFDTSNGSPDSDFIEAALRRYAETAGPASIPRWLDIAQLVPNTHLSGNARRAAVDVLQSLASSTSERGKKAADALQRFAADPGLPAELRKAAADASLESARYRNDLEERQQKWRARVQRDGSGQGIEKEINDIREMLAKADRGEVNVPPDMRTFMEFMLVARTRQLLLQESLEELRVALIRYRKVMDDRFPPDLDTLKEKTGFEARNGIQYFPVADLPARRVLGSVILAVIELPTDQMEQSPACIGVLYASGEVLELRRDDFVTMWERGNALRLRIGVPAIEPRQLGKLAHLLAPQSQPTRPSPATRSAAATQPSASRLPVCGSATSEAV